jgi:GNAT superfamily N-acetyltransferase
MRRRPFAAVKAAVRRRSARPTLRAARAIDYGFARQLLFSTMRELVDQAVGWNEFAMDLFFAREWDMRDVRIIRQDGRDIGWLQVRAGHNEMEMLDLFVLPSHQGQGVGTTILRQVLARAGKQGKSVSLSVMKGNRALGFYRRHGFVVTDEDRHEFTMRFVPRRSARGVGPSMGLRRG